MKKFLCLLLAEMLLFLCGCTAREGETLDAMLQEYLDNLSDYEENTEPLPAT